jgi:hypothetical protein
MQNNAIFKGKIIKDNARRIHRTAKKILGSTSMVSRIFLQDSRDSDRRNDKAVYRRARE